ncbi:DUF4383 domain-containing protein [Gandjariella thermophila]|uniref:DUF4383 domain-containing protein n=1 Tax=Gandjariella thermophila TaxID=1931992 RepID=A0A4D4J004_9PSEU|nr:DUF4383 domain-containing protein [Gandjariella thermophila]GDY28392.1 hypothetical protein GTS_00250 [Gandjariella thermophila]
MAPTDDRRRLRGARVAMAVEAVVLLALGVAGLVIAGVRPFTGQTESLVWFFKLNGLQSVLLLVTAVAAAVALTGRRALVAVCLLQSFGYLLLFVWGSANGGNPTSYNLNPADNALHIVLFIYGMAVAMAVSANAFETHRAPDHRGKPPRGRRHAGAAAGRR